MKVSTEIPDGMHPMQYAAHLLEEVMGWPLKGNSELVADCIKSIGKAKKLTPKQAYLYLVRAIRLAKEQGIEVNRFWFQGGEYTNIRPEVRAALRLYEPIDREKTKAEQATPEWQAASERARQLWAQIAGKAMP